MVTTAMPWSHFHLFQLSTSTAGCRSRAWRLRAHPTRKIRDCGGAGPSYRPREASDGE
jgi:hypothetical protein